MPLTGRHLKNLKRWVHRTQEMWEVFDQRFRDQPDSRMGVGFHAPSLTSAEALQAALRQRKFWNIQAGRSRWPFRRRWEVYAEGPLPSPTDLPSVTRWIEEMIELGTEFGADFDIWAPVRPGP